MTPPPILLVDRYPSTVDPVLQLLWMLEDGWSKSERITRIALAVDLNLRPVDPVSHDATKWSVIGALIRGAHDHGFRRGYVWPTVEHNFVTWAAYYLVYASLVFDPPRPSDVERMAEERFRKLPPDHVRPWLTRAREARQIEWEQSAEDRARRDRAYAHDLSVLATRR
jgi:hypothetical protein